MCGYDLHMAKIMWVLNDEAKSCETVLHKEKHNRNKIGTYIDVAYHFNKQWNSCS